MKTNLIKKVTAMIVIASLSFMLKSFDCPHTTQIPECPFPDPVFSVFFPHPHDCHYFFHCQGGIAFCFKCPAGLHWNRRLETCDYPYTAGCDGKTKRSRMKSSSSCFFNGTWVGVRIECEEYYAPPGPFLDGCVPLACPSGSRP